MNIGLFFGSFNPPHVGHINLALSFESAAHLNEVWWVVSPHNPHKSSTTLAPFQDRIDMVALALPNANHRLSNVENELPKPSFTINTLTRLKNEYPNFNFNILMGQDNWNTLPSWKEGGTIESEWPIWVYPRMGDRFFRPGVCHIIQGDFQDVSSTEIRENGNHLFDTTPPVQNYIKSKGLYSR